MKPGYDKKLYILAFDHRGSFQKKFFGIEGDPDAEQTAIIADAKHLIFEGLLQAVSAGADAEETGVLVDEQFGSTVPAEAREKGLILAMPAEKSGQPTFDFEYGDDFGEHIERFSPDFTKVLVRYNPDGDAEANREQLGKLLRLSQWLRSKDRKFLFELLVPAEEAQLASVGGDGERYDAELRPELMRRAIAEIQDAGIEADIWKIEGVDERSDCEMLVAQARTRRPRRRRVRRARPRRQRRQGGPVADGGRPGGRLRRLRHRPVDLVGPAQVLRGREDRAFRGCSRNRRELPALHIGLRARRGARGDLSAPSTQDDPMKMRQSLADLERAFVDEVSQDRRRRDSLRRTTEKRALKRETEKRNKRGSMRFLLLVLTLILTAVIVTVVMFRTLYLLLG